MWAYGDALNAASGAFRFLTLTDEPGVGTTRLLSVLVGTAAARKLAVLSGQAPKFEREPLSGAVIDVMDDHLEAYGPDLDPATNRLLAHVFPALSSAVGVESHDVLPPTALARFRLYSTVRVLEQLARPAGLVLTLNDSNWADDPLVELLDHLVRRPPRAGALIAVVDRPAHTTLRNYRVIVGYPVAGH